MKTLEQIAEITEEQYTFIKGKLYFSAKYFKRANAYVTKHLSYLEVQSRTLEVAPGMAETQAMLKHCV